MGNEHTVRQMEYRITVRCAGRVFSIPLPVECEPEPVEIMGQSLFSHRIVAAGGIQDYWSVSDVSSGLAIPGLAEETREDAVAAAHIKVAMVSHKLDTIMSEGMAIRASAECVSFEEFIKVADELLERRIRSSRWNNTIVNC